MQYRCYRESTARILYYVGEYKNSGRSFEWKRCGEREKESSYYSLNMGLVCTEHRAWSRTKLTLHISRNCVRFRIVVIRFERAGITPFFAGMSRVTFQLLHLLLHTIIYICMFFTVLFLFQQ